MLPLPVKLVRSLLLGETMNIPFHHHDDHHHHHDADDEHEFDDDNDHDAGKKKKKKKKKNNNKDKKKKKIPMLLFVPTKELITDTFRLASLARDIGMDFRPSPSLSHLFFSWPSPSSSSPSSSSTTFSPSTTATSSTSSSSAATSAFPNDAAPLPFPSLSLPTTSLSLLRYFVSLSRGLFKLVFFNPDGTDAGPDWAHNWPENGTLVNRVSGRRVGSMDELSLDMAAHGWTLFRTHKAVLPGDEVYLFRKKDSGRVLVGVKGGDGGGECRVREMRLPGLDFKSEVPSRILLYILLMTHDVFYLA